jgi:hypothetical protein
MRHFYFALTRKRMALTPLEGGHRIGSTNFQEAVTVVLRAFLAATVAVATAFGAAPPSWVGDFSPIGATDWNYDRAAHLLERAGFRGTPEEIQALAAMTPEQAVRRLVRYQEVQDVNLPPFRETGIYPLPHLNRTGTITGAFSAVSIRTLDKLTPEQRAYLFSDYMTGMTAEEKRIAKTQEEAITDMFYY